MRELKNESLRRTFLILAVIMMALLALLFFWVLRESHEQQARLELLREEALPLERQRETLLRELTALSQTPEETVAPPATEQLLVSELDETLYTQLYPLMRQRGFSGIMGLTLGGLPGADKKINFDQFNDLLTAGWGCCLVFNSGYDFDQWYETLNGWILEVGLTRPDVVYFHNGDWSAEMALKLQQYGFKTAVHHGEEQTAPELYSCYARPWDFDSVVSVVDALAANGGNAVFTVSFSGRDSDLFVESNFSNMLNYIKTYADRGEYLFTSFAEGRAIQENPDVRRVAVETKIAAEQAFLETQIDALDEQIHAIYTNWKIS